MRWSLSCAVVVLAGCWSSSQPIEVAQSAPGRSGFARAEHSRGFTLGLVTAQDRRWAVGVAAVTDAAGRRAGLWRVVDGGRGLEYCATDGCRAVAVPGGGWAWGPLVIVSPGARGRYAGQLDVVGVGAPSAATTYDDAGVDGPAVPAGGEAPPTDDAPPTDEVADATDGAGLPGTDHHGVWVLQGDELAHCVGPEGAEATCRAVGAADAVLGAMVVRADEGRADVVWIERDQAIWRCAGRGPAAACAPARMTQEVRR